MAQNEVKKSIAAPCGKVTRDTIGREITVYPGVDCAYNCETCGWNPAEKERRLKKGKWLPVSFYYDIRSFRTVELPEGTKHLVFPPLLK